MKKLLIMLLLLGITIYLDAETGMGYVFTNTAKENATFLVWPSTDSAIMYSDGIETVKFTYKELLALIGPQIKENIKGATSAIIKLPPPKEAPKIIY